MPHRYSTAYVLLQLTASSEQCQQAHTHILKAGFERCSCTQEVRTAEKDCPNGLLHERVAEQVILECAHFTYAPMVLLTSLQVLCGIEFYSSFERREMQTHLVVAAGLQQLGHMAWPSPLISCALE